MVRTINFDGYVLILEKTSYEHDNSLAVHAKTDEGESYAVLTVNLDFPLYSNSDQFFDINLYKGQEIMELLVKEKIIQLIGFELQSGFVTYPLVHWNLEWKEEIK